MLKLLYRLFPKQFNELVFYSQKKSVELANTEFVFIDSNGKRYYRFTVQGEAPIVRWTELQMLIAQLSYCLADKELEVILNQIETAVNKQKPDTSAIHNAIYEIRLRKKLLVHYDLMLEMMGVLLIREDQTKIYEVWDKNVEEEKINQFKKDIQLGGIADFFYSAKLNEYLPYLDTIKDSLPELLKENSTLINQLLKKSEAYSLGQNWLKNAKANEKK